MSKIMMSIALLTSIHAESIHFRHSDGLIKSDGSEYSIKLYPNKIIIYSEKFVEIKEGQYQKGTKTISGKINELDYRFVLKIVERITDTEGKSVVNVDKKKKSFSPLNNKVEELSELTLDSPYHLWEVEDGAYNKFNILINDNQINVNLKNPIKIYDYWLLEKVLKSLVLNGDKSFVEKKTIEFREKIDAP